MCKISNLFEIANMDFLACEISPEMPFFGLQPTLVAPNSTKSAMICMKLGFT